MEKSNPVQEKAFSFAIHIVSFCRKMMTEENEYVLSKQLLRSGTSIGANIEEGIHAFSKKDFIHKLSISFKEAHESKYWLLLIQKSNIPHALDDSDRLLSQLKEIIALLTAILKTSKQTLES